MIGKTGQGMRKKRSNRTHGGLQTIDSGMQIQGPTAGFRLELYYMNELTKGQCQSGATLYFQYKKKFPPIRRREGKIIKLYRYRALMWSSSTLVVATAVPLNANTGSAKLPEEGHKGLSTSSPSRRTMTSAILAGSAGARWM